MLVKTHPLLAVAFQAGLLAGAVVAASASVDAKAAETPSAQQLVEKVMQNESRADQSDHSRWIYRDRKQLPNRSTVKIVVETAAGDLGRTVELNGHALNSQERAQDDEAIEALVNSPERQQKARQASEHDDQQAHAFMAALPKAFLWTEAGRNDGKETLDFKPNPQFQPKTRELRVLASMSGEMTVDLKQGRLWSLSGRLTAPVEFGFGLLGKLQKGGTFHIERREVGPGEWQTTQTEVHIQGKALIFKSINEQQNEETSGYKPAPPSLGLSQAAEMLRAGAIQPNPSPETDALR